MKSLSPVLSLLLCLCTIVCYALRPDSCAAVTLWPVWVWVLPGLFLLALGWTKRRRRLTVVVGMLWLVYLLAFADEPRSLLHFRQDQTSERIRVVSLNCAGGSAEAASEVAQYRPDIVLLQESPGREDVEKLARKLFGKQAAVAWGVDASIIARGGLKQAKQSRHAALDFTQATVRLPSGVEVEVASVRLIPPVFRFDLWSPECWRDQTENRRVRREQLKPIAAQLKRIPGRVPIIIGGDLNAPAGDAAFRALTPRLRDSFKNGGKGWGNTVLNDVPVLRFDQIWTSKELEPSSVTARKTVHSDHRMVVCDLVLKNRR